MTNKQLKQEMVRNILALDALRKGDRQPAIEAVQLGELSDDQLTHGLTERIKARYGYLSHHRTAAFFLGAATNVLSGGVLPESTISALKYFLETA